MTCLEPSTYADLFTVKDTGFCVVALYDADEIAGSPTWGRHGGPMYVTPAPQEGSVAVVRLAPPAGTSGKLAATSTTFDVALPAMAFLGGQAVDLPFFDWTAIAYTQGDLSGEVILLEGQAVATRYPVNGFFSAAALGSGSAGRLVYSGLSVLGDVVTKKNAIYAADACGSPGNMPRLLPAGDMTCAAPLEVSSYDDYSGPVAADRAGNVFVVLSTPTDQTARGFAARQDQARRPRDARRRALHLARLRGEPRGDLARLERHRRGRVPADRRDLVRVARRRRAALPRRGRLDRRRRRPWALPRAHDAGHDAAVLHRRPGSTLGHRETSDGPRGRRHRARALIAPSPPPSGRAISTGARCSGRSFVRPPSTSSRRASRLGGVSPPSCVIIRNASGPERRAA